MLSDPGARAARRAAPDDAPADSPSVAAPPDAAPPDGAAPPPGPAFARTVPATPLDVRAVLRAAVGRFAPRIGPDEAGVLELALAEVLNNVVEHGYADTRVGEVRVVIRRTAAGLACRVEDLGLPVPAGMLAGGGTPPPGLPGGGAGWPADPSEISEGGYGWSLIRALVTDLAYEREGGVNRIRFVVPAVPAPAPVPDGLPQSCRKDSQPAPD